MTSAVTLKAHCAKTKHLRVIITDPTATPNKTEFFLNDGESKEVHVCDSRTLHTMEEEKPEVPVGEATPKKGKKDKDKAEDTGPDAAAGSPAIADAEVKAATVDAAAAETGTGSDAGGDSGSSGGE